jgi:hypothetical protein
MGNQFDFFLEELNWFCMYVNTDAHFYKLQYNFRSFYMYFVICTLALFFFFETNSS